MSNGNWWLRIVRADGTVTDLWVACVKQTETIARDMANAMNQAERSFKEMNSPLHTGARYSAVYLTEDAEYRHEAWSATRPKAADRIAEICAEEDE